MIHSTNPTQPEKAVIVLPSQSLNPRHPTDPNKKGNLGHHKHRSNPNLKQNKLFHPFPHARQIKTLNLKQQMHHQIPGKTHRRSTTNTNKIPQEHEECRKKRIYFLGKKNETLIDPLLKTRHQEPKF